MHNTPHTVLITGGNGNIGRMVADKLLARGQQVVKFDIPGTEAETARTNEVVITGDVREHEKLKAILEEYQPGAIYHLASLLSGSSEADLDAAWDINATASFKLFHYAVETGVEQVLFASTQATYSDIDVRPMPNDQSQWPESMYGATKVAVERLGVYFKQKHGLDFRCLRFPMVISPFAPKTAVTGYPAHAFRAAMAGEHFSFPVSAQTGISTMALEDVIDSIIQLSDAHRGSLTQHAYNLHAYYLNCQMIIDAIERRFPGFEYDFVINDHAQRLISSWPDEPDDSAARRDWGWQPRYDFESSCDRLMPLLGTGLGS